MKRVFLIFTFILIPILPKSVFAVTPQVSSLSTNSTSVGRYKKFEVTFLINKSYPAGSFLPYYYYDSTDTPASDPDRNFYGIDGVSIDAVLTSPSGKVITQPAFYYEDFVRSGDSNGESITTTNNFSWKIRFTPEELGTYNYYISIKDKDGSTRYPPSGNLTFTSTASTSKGFVVTSLVDSRFMAFSNGESFIPIGTGKQWWRGGGRSFYYEDAFNQWKLNGINFTRIWDQNDAYGLTVEGHFDSYKYPDDFNPVDTGMLNTIVKGTQFNQRGNYDEDKIIEAAEKNNIYIQLCSHGDPYWIWDGATYNESWNTTAQAFDSKRHIDYWKRNMRYRIARWGYSTSIMAWEVWNEHGQDMFNYPGVVPFYKTLGDYQQAIDPYDHLFTTSQGSQAYSPGFWSLPQMDLANYHNYMMSWMPNQTDEVAFVNFTAWCLSNGYNCSSLGLGDGTSWSGVKKPWVWGEIDVGTAVWNETNPKTKTGGARIRMLHNTTWAGLFSPLGTSPLDWYWDQEDSTTTTQRYADRKATAAFFNGVDYDKANFTYLMSSNFKPTGYSGETISGNDQTDRVLAMRRGDKKAMYAWVVDSTSTWNNYSNSPTVSGFTAQGLNAGENYLVTVWNTKTGTVASTTTATGPSFNVSLSGLTEDAAVKIESSSGLPTPTPTTSSCPKKSLGDLDCNGTIDIFDYNQILSDFGKTGSPGFTPADINTDGKVDIFDYNVLLSNFGK